LHLSRTRLTSAVLAALFFGRNARRLSPEAHQATLLVDRYCGIAKEGSKGWSAQLTIRIVPNREVAVSHVI
jgi:hypothetical protein